MDKFARENYKNYLYINMVQTSGEKEDSGRITRKNVNYAIGWLYRSHVIGFCGQVNECNPVDTSMNRRFYFMDLGVCRYFLGISGADRATVKGIVNENFVYIEFFVRNRENERNYGIEERKITVPVYLVSRVEFDYQYKENG